MIWWKSQRLKSKNPTIRLRTLQQMAKAGDPSLLDSLGDGVKDPDVRVRTAAVRMLGTIQHERSLELLAAAVKDSVIEVRVGVVNSLRQIGDSRAIAPLVSALEDSQHAVRWQAATALNSLGWRPTHNTEFIRHSVATGNHEQAAIHGHAAAVCLINALKDPACPRRHAAAAALGKAGDMQAVESLEAALKDPDSHVRVAAVGALSEIGSSQSANALLELLGDANNLVRAASVEALSRLGDARVVQRISDSLLRDSSWEVRKLSVEALGRIKDDLATQLLWQALKDQDHDVRQIAAAALGHIPEPRSIGPLVLALKDENSSVRQAAKASLRQIDRQWELSAGAQSVIPELEAAVNDREYWVAQSAADTLAKIYDMRQRSLDTSFIVNPSESKLRVAVEVLADLLRDADRDVRQAAVEALGRIGNAGSVAPLVTALDDTDLWVGRAAALALNHLNWEPDRNAGHSAEKFKSLMLHT